MRKNIDDNVENRMNTNMTSHIKSNVNQRMTNASRLAAHALVLLLCAATASAQRSPKTSCVACHQDEELFDAEQVRQIIGGFHEDVHAAVGLSCHDCHGGNPDLAVAEDMEAAMDEGYAANPYRGVPARAEIPGSCGRCHSDPAYMKRFRPDARVDQEREYWTSQHGQALRDGNTKVATCVDCHGVHGIRGPGDAQSPVYATHVAETCNTCHGDAKTMHGSTTRDGLPLPVDQYGRWRRSVHATAMFNKGDLSAPTCNDCHGNHGAAPPGFESVTFVCGQCHGREAELFRDSPKHEGFVRHNEYMADAGSDGCAACHEPPHPAASWSKSHGLSECASCHGNHSIVRPTVALLSPLPQTPCAFCHEAPDQPLFEESERVRQNYAQTRSNLLEQAVSQGLEGERLFDWLVDRALELPNHTYLPATEDDVELVLRPEFARLFQKFRIGKVHYDFIDPATGEQVEDRVRRCTDCHAPESDAGEESAGRAVAQEFLTNMQELTVATAGAERVLLRAKRGGVEVREAMGELDLAVDAQIQLEVLVHTFDASGKFAEAHDAGLESAGGALAAGEAALQELSSRRTGLAVSSIFILLVLVGLALKIRQSTG